jgi:hypothetical protein
MLKRTIFFYLVAIGLLLQGCYYDNETVLYNVGAGGSACDTTNVTYSGTIAPIMATSCNMCHVASSGNRVITSDYPNLILAIANANFVRDVNWTSGADQMPKNGQMLPSCVLAKINKWVKNGALNN